MAGLLEEYGLDLGEIEVPGYDIPDGAHTFIVGDLFVKVGSKNNPDKSWIILEFLVDESGKRFSELYELPKDMANQTDDEKKRLGRYKGRLVSLGIPEEDVNSVGRDEVVGITGTFQLRTTQGTKGGTFQNIRNLQVDDEGSNAFQSQEPAVEDAPVAKAPVRRPAAAKPATTVDNPFAK